MEHEEKIHLIGTLKEKTLHSVVKNYIEPDMEKQEIRLGRYYVDILNETGIVEVQTQNFNLLRKKLDAFLPDYTVTVAYPMIATKWLYWVDEKTGEISKKRKSPLKGSYYRCFYELYKIKQYLTDPNIRIHLLLINMEEYRLLNGWSQDKKRGSTRQDRVPTEIVEEYTLKSVEDYQKLIPPALRETFTSKDFAREAKLTQRVTQCGMNVLHYVGAIERIGKEGRMYVYRRAE
ncbi:hypothetical protein [[Clostridium] polysaccharolyticum]|uniref:DUF8091 domain-containing protein n=1 Tax=[Clostridium] polysaccharolyticum TaxID=29364 RepID=A0A1I0FPG8_9FIRM|nr:hypothetical protein [[Clostridium] polysaccharolyticum]SET59994.1 hypothetical protein SAMN04487772_13428 [[Clostridium] polysaccharolyticum]